ncbi:MAG: SigB/SigF/SigG family RNA polymerase sigma factor [Bacilli bacterium]
MGKYKVDITGLNTYNLKELTQDEMRELFKNINTNPFAREKLITGNYKLVLSILKNYTQRSDNMDDLFQIGVIGLIKAIDNFDLKYNVRFSTYAVPMILGEVRRFLRDNNPIKVSRSLKDIAYKALKAKDILTQNTGREPNIEEISKEIEIDKMDIVIAFDAMKTPVSMYEPIYSDGSDVIYLLDQLENKKDMYDLETKISLDKALSTLEKRDYNILFDRFIYGKTQVEIASEIGISQAQVSRIEKTAIEDIKKKIKGV